MKDDITAEVRNAQYLAHSQAILDTQKRLEKLEINFDGMPQEIKFIKANIDRMCVSMDKLLERLETKYVPRELFDNTTVSLREQTRDLRDDMEDKLKVRDEKLGKLEEQNKWLVRGMLASALYVLKDILMPLIAKH